ncbi:FecR family protein [Pseudoflavitalea sp. G-6-1-2]|uniref:FecR family protein n=1 Tax=Pseudoflavitalea sp. G-6-1-2 TaxID=2728841 RepID=UPI00146A4F5B|nr:FecR family protein [Pseudoflavitalea sp. G-6-1-2]NML20934.1 FecR family protein [Pseudoflavitalea sp. G-6-1-2]
MSAVISMMNNRQKETELIKKMLSGILTASEQQQVNNLMSNPSFQQLFHEVLDEQAGDVNWEYDAANDAVNDQKLAQFHEKLSQEEESNSDDTPVVTMRPPLWKRVLPYAAAVIIAVGTYIFWSAQPESKLPPVVAQEVKQTPSVSIQKEKPVQYAEQYNPKKRRMKLTLSDGSVVTLGGKSRIKYATGFAGSHRDLYLEGEAFFEVAKDAGKPFIVHTGNVHTQVLGTSFKVSAMPKSAVEVAVVTGKVRVSYSNGAEQNTLATMIPGDMISWTNSHLTKMKIDTRDILAWKNEMMIFKKQTLENILNVFEKHYGVAITVINKGFLTEKISLALDEKMPLEKAMNVLAVTAGFEHSFDSLSRTVIIK